jgi:hypothetical protein
MLPRTDVRFTLQMRDINMRKILIAALLVAIVLPALAQTAMACSREQLEALQSQRDGVQWSLQRNDTSRSPESLRGQTEGT